MRIAENIKAPQKVGFQLKRENGEPFEIEVRYDKLCGFCYKCGMVGHDKEDCESEEDTLVKYGPWLRVGVLDPNKIPMFGRDMKEGSSWSTSTEERDKGLSAGSYKSEEEPQPSFGKVNTNMEIGELASKIIKGKCLEKDLLSGSETNTLKLSAVVDKLERISKRPLVNSDQPKAHYIKEPKYNYTNETSTIIRITQPENQNKTTSFLNSPPEKPTDLRGNQSALFKTRKINETSPPNAIQRKTKKKCEDSSARESVGVFDQLNEVTHKDFHIGTGIVGTNRGRKWKKAVRCPRKIEDDRVDPCMLYEEEELVLGDGKLPQYFVEFPSSPVGESEYL